MNYHGLEQVRHWVLDVPAALFLSPTRTLLLQGGLAHKSCRVSVHARSRIQICSHRGRSISRRGSTPAMSPLRFRLHGSVHRSRPQAAGPHLQESGTSRHLQCSTSKPQGEDTPVLLQNGLHSWRAQLHVRCFIPIPVWITHSPWDVPA